MVMQQSVEAFMNGQQTTGRRWQIPATQSRRTALGRLGLGALTLATLSARTTHMAFGQATPGTGTTEAVALQAIDAENVALSTGTTDAIDQVFAPDVAGHPPHRSLVTGESFSHDLTGPKAGLADIRQFFPDAAITIDDLITTDDRVAARITFRGTLDTAALGTTNGAGKPLEISGLLYGLIADGRVTEFWAYFDPTVYFDLIGGLSPTALATPEMPSASGAATPEASSDQTGTQQVTVTLSEFSIALAPTSLQAGHPYTFVVTNAGTVPHEFVIEAAGATHEPLLDGSRMAMVEGIGPGETRTLDWTFASPGAYQVACHEPGHYEAGQVLAIEVTG